MGRARGEATWTELERYDEQIFRSSVSALQRNSADYRPFLRERGRVLISSWRWRSENSSGHADIADLPLCTKSYVDNIVQILNAVLSAGHSFLGYNILDRFPSPNVDVLERMK